MSLYQKLVNKEEKLALVGLGYVGMPIAVAFAKKGLNVIGFDLNKAKIDLYKSGIDPTREVGDDVNALRDKANADAAFMAEVHKVADELYHDAGISDEDYVHYREELNQKLRERGLPEIEKEEDEE